MLAKGVRYAHKLSIIRGAHRPPEPPSDRARFARIYLIRPSLAGAPYE